MAEKVLVTGGSGFIAGWCIVDLLQRGYDVRTSVRNLAKADAVRAAIAAATDASRLSFAAAELMSDSGWDDAVAGCDYVLHVASPLGATAAKSADDYVIPAREGALRVLRAATKAGVKRVVMTSSCAAVAPRDPKAAAESDETNWADPALQRNDWYRLSKTLAERAAWDFMAGPNAKTAGTQFTTVLPAAVFGPILSAESMSSVQLIKRLLDGSTPRTPRLGMCVVDVRDVADLHIRAMIAPQAPGERFIASGPFLWMQEIAAILRAQLGDRAAKTPTRGVPDFVVRIGALANPALRPLVPLLNRQARYSWAKAKRVLDWRPRPTEATLTECAESLYAQAAL